MLLLYLGLLVAFTTVLCELAAKREWIPYWVSRKILHVVAVGSCAVAGYTADSLGHRELLTWIVAGAEVLLIGLVGFGGLMREESGRRAWGIVWFPLAFLVLLVVMHQAEMIGFCMAVLAVCDPAATVAGKVLSRNPYPNEPQTETLDESLIENTRTKHDRTKAWSGYNLTGDPKTLVGSIAFLVSFLLLIVFFPKVGTLKTIYGGFAGVTEDIYLLGTTPYSYILIAGILLSTSEALGSYGSDNITVPLLSVFLFSPNRFTLSSEFSSLPLFIILLTCTAFIFISTKRKSLTLGGAMSASLLGCIIFISTGWTWLMPLLLFFGSSVMIGRLFPSRSAAADTKQKLARDAVQVLANGGGYGVLACLAFYSVDNYMQLNLIASPFPSLLLLTAATATADTWSSELGQYFRRPTWDLVKWRRVPAGLSGGVSWPGTLAGLGGAALIACLGWWLLPEPTLSQILLITGFGFLGMLLDSVLGSLLQATYRDPATGALSDVCPEGGELVSGFPWMTNDLVNFLAIGLAAVLAALLL